MDDRSMRLANLAAHGANVQEGQIVLVNAELGHEKLVRAVATAAYQRGAKFVDVSYFDPHVKRARIEHADPDTLEFVPEWYGDRARQHADQHGARINLNGVTAPNLLDDLDKTLVGRDRLPRLKEQGQIVSERSTNWCIVPAPTRPWAALVFPELAADEAYEELWRQIEHVLRLDEADPASAWGDRMAGAVRGWDCGRDRCRRDRRAPARAARRRRRGPPPRRARARRPSGPDRPARHRLLRHAARRECRKPHRARHGLPLPRRRERDP